MTVTPAKERQRRSRAARQKTGARQFNAMLSGDAMNSLDAWVRAGHAASAVVDWLLRINPPVNYVHNAFKRDQQHRSVEKTPA